MSAFFSLLSHSPLSCTIITEDGSAKRRRIEEPVTFEPARFAVEGERTRKLLKKPEMRGGSRTYKECADLTQPFMRQTSVCESAQIIESCVKSAGVDTTGVLALMFHDRTVECLGKGSTGAIYRVEHSGRQFAIKTMMFSKSRVELEREAQEKSHTRRRATDGKLAVAEQRIAAFITRRVIGTDNPVLAHCPNFVSLYAYELTHNHPRFETCVFQFSRLWKNYACVAASEVFNAGNGEAVRLKHDPTATSPFETEEMAFSFIAQSLIAMTMLAAIGVSHNDTAHRNFVAHSAAAREVFYEFPRDEHETSVLGIRTNGVLWALTDFGLSTQSHFKTTGDTRFPDNYDSARDAEYLRDEYFPAKEFRKRSGLFLLDEKKDDCGISHPLQCELSDFERDVAFFLSETIMQTREEPSRARICAYARAALEKFDVPRTVQSASMHMEITRKVLSQDFTTQFFGARQAARFYATKPEPYRHIYRLPTQLESQFLTEDLARLLNSELCLHSIVCTAPSEKIN